ncbi:helix-turn-helix domain-containing protein [Dyella kyungheensis]|uniref:helix-turn-helix domain-containing protein n=1 Tax=Dyella kyungheensis TaxID=1242174 RepID=UPI003CEE4196
MSKPLSGLLSQMSAPARTAAEARKAELLRDRPFAFIRAALGLLQGRVAEALGVSQVAISKLESRGDFHLSTLATFVRATGGQLKIRADYAGRSFSIVEADVGTKKPRFRVEDVLEDVSYQTAAPGWTTAGRVSMRSVTPKFVVAANDHQYADYACGAA